MPLTWGSSPRVRGKLSDKSFKARISGLIPACAGKTLPGPARIPQQAAHPRVCGENEPIELRALRMPGSSPRVRGKLSDPPGWLDISGLIPACAGKTFGDVGFNASRRAHPRVCGENEASRYTSGLFAGSSPRVRGKPRKPLRSRARTRLIPACAGKTGGFVCSRLRAGAHPRVCGENAERSGVLTLRSVRSWKTLSFPSSLKITHCRAFVQLSLSRIRL